MGGRLATAALFMLLTSTAFAGDQKRITIADPNYVLAQFTEALKAIAPHVPDAALTDATNWHNLFREKSRSQYVILGTFKDFGDVTESTELAMDREGNLGTLSQSWGHYSSFERLPDPGVLLDRSPKDSIRQGSNMADVLKRLIGRLDRPTQKKINGALPPGKSLGKTLRLLNGFDRQMGKVRGLRGATPPTPRVARGGGGW